MQGGWKGEGEEQSRQWCKAEHLTDEKEGPLGRVYLEGVTPVWSCIKKVFQVVWPADARKYR